jgi:biotin-(acetyl-CoA carboxylase) ligase
LSQEFRKDLLHFLDNGFSPFIEAYRSYITTDPDKVIRFHDNRRVWEGTFHAINDDGSFSLKLADGELKTFIAGEILWPGE